jgi:hypothetical protein
MELRYPIILRSTLYSPPMCCSVSSRLASLAFALFAATLVHASLAPSDALLAGALLRRDGHHRHKGGPLLVLNETEIAMYHTPTPNSYYTIDWEGAGEPGPRYPALMMTHIILMCLAFFVVLPIGKVLLISPSSCFE